MTAGAAGTTITFKHVKLQTDSSADAFDNPAQPIPVRVFCDPLSAIVLGSVQVVTPPPPGAPDAKADTGSTNVGQAVKVDVLANDVANDVLPIDQSSLAVTVNGTKDTAVVNADHTVTYAPIANATGTDTFTYKLCSQLPAPTTTTSTTVEVEEKIPTAIVEPAAAPCDTAIVTVSIIVPVTPTTLRVAAAAPAAAPELPRTGGGSSLPLAAAGVVIAIAGALALGGAHRLRRSSCPDRQG